MPRWPRVCPSVVFAAGCFAGTAFAQSVPAAGPGPSLSASRVPTPPVLDGRLDESSWQAAASAGDFRQYEPVEGAPATERTEVRVLYDNTSIYVGVRLYDSEPAGIVTRMSRRA